MNLSEHFTYAEFTHSETAQRIGVDNDIPVELLHNAQATAAMLERIRAFLGCPMTVTSGYRCLAVNRALKSKDTSDHVHALACDFVCPPTPPLLIAQRLAAVMDELQIGQLIYEHTWIHVGVSVPEKANNRVLTVQPWGYSTGITGV
jgi:hypothetical protein